MSELQYPLKAHFIDTVREIEPVALSAWFFLLSQEETVPSGKILEALEKASYTSEYVNQQIKLLKTAPLDELLKWAYAEVNSIGPVQILLQLNDSADLLERVKKLANNGAKDDQIVALRILKGRLGKKYVTDAENIIGVMANTDLSWDVLLELIETASELQTEKSNSVILKFATHTDSKVRRAAAAALDPEKNGSLSALICLTRDDDSQVRNNATFALASQTTATDEIIREALFERLTDTHSNTREEAIAGLARLNDSRVIQTLIELLQKPTVSRLIIETAGQMGRPEFYSILVGLKKNTPEKNLPILLRAIDKCKV